MEHIKPETLSNQITTKVFQALIQANMPMLQLKDLQSDITKNRHNLSRKRRKLQKAQEKRPNHAQVMSKINEVKKEVQQRRHNKKFTMKRR